jgi:hypothetical protein
MTLNPESLYRQLGRLLEEMPGLANWGAGAGGTLTDEAHRWLGRADALVQETGDVRDSVEFRMGAANLDRASRPQGIEQIKRVLYRALAAAELSAPPAARGAFIPVGSSFDAFAAISKILQTAKRDVFVVDPYMDETALTEFGLAVPERLSFRLLADQKDHKPTLTPAAQKWASQYGGTRPLAVRLAAPRTLHDRAIFIDGSGAWTLTQSLKDFAKRSPAEIVRADDTAALKIAAYEGVWSGASVVV